jgi:hypothetical protein
LCCGEPYRPGRPFDIDAHELGAGGVAAFIMKDADAITAWGDPAMAIES